MASENEKVLRSSVDVFFTKLSERRVIKLEGAEDYLNVPQYQALVNIEKKCSQLETDAVTRIMESKIAYLKAKQELMECEERWFKEVQNGMDTLDERNATIKDVNMRMHKGDYSILQNVVKVETKSTAHSEGVSKKESNYTAVPVTRPPVESRGERAAGATHKSSQLSDIKKRLAMLSMDTPNARPPLQSININKPETSSTPNMVPVLSSKGSLNGSVVPNRAPTTPLSQSKWDVPKPNFDETMDTDEVMLPTSSTHHEFARPRHLPSALLQSTVEEEEEEEAEHTFPLPRPSLPFQTPTVPLSRPFLLSSLREEKNKEERVPPSESRPVMPTPTSLSRPPSEDPLGSMGLMRIQRPVLTSQVGKKLMGQL